MMYQREATAMVRENPISVIIIILIVVVAVVGQANKKDGGGLMLKSRLEQGPATIPVVVFAVLVALGYAIWKRGQPWKRR